MKRLKEIYNTIKKGLENPRLRAITILGMYAIFFFLVFAFLNAGSRVNTNAKNENNNSQIKNIENYKNISNNYKYSCTIDYNEDGNIEKYLLTGKISNTEKNELVQIYNKDLNEYSIIEKPNFINDDFIILDKIIPYVNKKEYEFSTSYKDGSILKNYKVPLGKINEIYSNAKAIEINIYELNDNISKIVIDSTNYDKVENDKIESVLYTIEYENIK